MMLKKSLVTMLVLVLLCLQGCTLLEVKSTKSESSQQTTESKKDPEADLKARVAELEKRVKALEDKLEGRW